MADGRLGPPQPLGRPCDAAVAHQHLEDGEKVEVEALQIDFIHEQSQLRIWSMTRRDPNVFFSAMKPNERAVKDVPFQCVGPPQPDPGFCRYGAGRRLPVRWQPGGSGGAAAACRPSSPDAPPPLEP